MTIASVMRIRSFFATPIAAFWRAWIRQKFENGTYALEAAPTCLCGCEDFERIADSDRYGIPVGVNLCKCCGLGVQSPRPTEEALQRFYQADYRKLYRGTTKINQDYFLRSHRRGQRIFEFLSDHGLRTTDSVVVEVGCGPGGILKVFQEQGNDVWGCELDTQCVEFSNEQGIPTLSGGAEALADVGVKADLIVLSHLLEHVPQPFEFMATLRDILTDKGLLYVEVPGVRNPRTNFFDGVQVAHLYYYDLTTLQFVMGKAGFRLITGDETVRSIFRQEDGEVLVQLEDNYERNVTVIQNWVKPC